MGSTCGSLFSLATPLNGTAPTDTVALALSMAHNPGLHANSIFGYAPPASPFNPVLLNAPNDWSIGIIYSGSSISSPKSTSVDAAGNIWIANSGNNTITVLAQTGSRTLGSPLSGNGLSGPSGIAFDLQGNAWVTDKTSSQISTFNAAGGVFAGSPFSNTTLSSPLGIAADSSGQIWIANSGNSSVTELNSSGVLIQQNASSVSQPGAIAINPQ